MNYKENEPLPRIVYTESIANEARFTSSTARQLACLALVISLLALVAALVGLFL